MIWGESLFETFKSFYFYVKYSSETSNNTQLTWPKKNPPEFLHSTMKYGTFARLTNGQRRALYRINYMYDTVITYATAFHTRASNANTIYSC